MTQAIINQNIAADVQRCMDFEKKYSLLRRWFVSKESYRGKCEDQARQKYAADIRAAQQSSSSVDNALNAALRNELTNDPTKLMGIAVVVLVAVIIIVSLLKK